MIPHITDEIKAAIRRLSPENDVVIVDRDPDGEALTVAAAATIDV